MIWAIPTWTSLAESPGVTAARNLTERPSLRISLNGQEGLLGEVLIRGCGPGVYSSSRRELVGECADHLVLALENISQRRRWNGNQRVHSAKQGIAEASASGVLLNQIFRHFATEIRSIVEFHRLSVFLVNPELDLATCAYQTGEGVARQWNNSVKLSTSALAQTANRGESRVFADLSEQDASVVWNQLMPPGMRSALPVPLPYLESTVGMVLLEHRLPRAFGTADQTCLAEVVAALSPVMAHMGRPNPPALPNGQPNQDLVHQELANIFGSSQSLVEIFPPLVATLAKSIPIDRARISWIDPNGYDFCDLRASFAIFLTLPFLAVGRS